MRPAHLMQRLQFLPGIDGADLGGLGDKHHPRLDHMRGHIVLLQHGKDARRAHLSIVIRDDQHLMAGGLDGAGFVGEDMAGCSADDGLVRAQGGSHGDEVGLGTAG